MKNENNVTVVTSEQISLPILIERIASREPEIEAGRTSVMRETSKTIALVIEQGHDLIAAKSLVGHGNWLQWLSKNYSASHDTAYRYMRLAANYAHVRNLKDDTSLRQAMKAAGLLPEPEPSNQPPSINISPIISKLNFVAEWVTKSADEISTWEEIRRQELKLQLKPVVELFQKL